MKIRSLLLAGLIVGQAAPVMAMDRPNNWALNAVRTATAACVNASTLINKASTPCVLAADFLLNHPYWTLGLYTGGLLSMIAADKLNKYFNIGYKIDCWRGKYSLESQLLRAAWRGDLVTMEKLLNQGANPNVNAYSCNSLLLTAIHNNNESMVDLVIKAGADVNAQNFLFHALRARLPLNKKMAKKLIEAGANPDMITPAGDGRTVRQYAQILVAQTGNQDYINVFNPESKLL
jgi:hypothetical protein